MATKTRIEEADVQEEVGDEECPECGTRARQDGDETVCPECGLVVDEDRIDRGPEWIFHGPDEPDRRAGTPRTEFMHDHGLGSEIGSDVVDSGRQAWRLTRMRRANKRANFRGKGERNLAQAITEVQRMGSAIGMSETKREQAVRICRQSQQAELWWGRSIEAIAGASLYAVDRIVRGSLTLADLDEVSRVERDRIEMVYNALNQELGLPVPPPHPTEYVGAIVSELDGDASMRRRAMELAEAWAEVHDGKGKNPVGVAAAAVYRAGPHTQREVADVSDVCEITLRERHHELQEIEDGD